MAEDKREEIKVTDRRHFHADGTRRSEVAGGDEAETTRPTSVGGAQIESDSEPPPTERPPEAPTFLEFLAGLVGGAASHLGLVPHPASGKAVVDLSGAKQMIGILTILEEKTKGNLTPEEKQFLESALTELRLAYVRAASRLK